MTKNTNSVVHKEAYARYFKSHFNRYQSLDPNDLFEYYEQNVKSSLPMDPNAKILEIGAGLGKFSHYLKKCGYTNVTSIDISAELAQLAKQHAGVDVTVVDDPAVFLEAQTAGSYDTVCMFDVIEHMRKESVVAFLLLIHRVLKPAGTFHVSTENMASPVGGRIQHYLDFTHEYNFSEISLRQVLDIAGFSEITIAGMRENITGIRSLLLWTARRLLFAIYRFVYFIERQGMVRPTIFSKELIASAKKIS